jgi:RNA polymerase sigma factor (TIGR02999 family)
MRRVLVDYARSRGRRKRGGDAVRVTFAESLPVAGDDSLLAQVDEALQALARQDERKSRVVELKFFGGLTVTEIAQVLGVSSATVMRDWMFAKAWLTRQMAGAQPARPGKPDFRREDCDQR